ncbi:MAG TPA: hypothetical protein VEI07_19270 [Planctomycetaceae bacterium]|nr:hypothetical protein [Planctomycetaceae bacterium]
MTKRDRAALKSLVGFGIMLALVYEALPLLGLFKGVGWLLAIALFGILVNSKLSFWFRDKP